MGQAIAVRTDYSIEEVRSFARKAKNAAQARRLLAIAAVLEGASRTEAARIGGMDRHEAVYFTEQGGERSAILVIEIGNPSEVPEIAPSPLFPELQCQM